MDKTQPSRGPSRLRAWMDEQYRNEPGLRERVQALIAEMDLEEELVALRQSAGLSQRDIAERLGVKQPVVAKLESGHAKNMGVETLARYAVACGGEMRISFKKKSAAAGRSAAAKGHFVRVKVKAAGRPRRTTG